MTDRRFIEETSLVKEREHSANRDGLAQSPMVPLFSDTRPEAEAVLIELLRQASPWRKLHMVGQLNQTVRTLALSGLRQRYPQATPQELRRRLADLLLGPDLAARVYGPLERQAANDEEKM
ncbi:MAG: hypothetical protein B6I34_09320 [Anaerolineaceae bacterium 4572_32.1]|nr:MAG: hypothetical protein B6I34_09320 [Anaerolineaceae bacterium 4572_32.1]